MDKAGGASAPTGCYKCGRPGHWSRDCPFSPSADPNSSNSNFKASSAPSKSNFSKSSYPSSKPAEKSSSEKPKKQLPRTRPKLTPELLLSDDGLGYVLRHFPRSFKYHGRGHEARDLGNLIGMYAQWHSRLLPYYSFDQFVHKVEKVGASKRVRMCVRELRDRVANGGDPTKLHEPPVEDVVQNPEPEKDIDLNDSAPNLEDPELDFRGADDSQEELINDIYQKATEEPTPSKLNENAGSGAAPQEVSARGAMQNQVPGVSENSSTKARVTEEQKARMEANRLKALSRIAVQSLPQASQ